jgi:hypothetical protein
MWSNVPDGHFLRPYTFHCNGCVPFLRSVTLPTLSDVGTSVGYAVVYERLEPSDLARALVAAVPTLRGIGVGNKEPIELLSRHPGYWVWHRGLDGSASSLPEWLWDGLPLCVLFSRAKGSTTEAAATWALESTLYGLVKEAK